VYRRGSGKRVGDVHTGRFGTSLAVPAGTYVLRRYMEKDDLATIVVKAGETVVVE